MLMLILCPIHFFTLKVWVGFFLANCFYGNTLMAKSLTLLIVTSVCNTRIAYVINLFVIIGAIPSSFK
jgi:hypothetical protein